MWYHGGWRMWERWGASMAPYFEFLGALVDAGADSGFLPSKDKLAPIADNELEWHGTVSDKAPQSRDIDGFSMEILGQMSARQLRACLCVRRRRELKYGFAAGRVRYSVALVNWLDTRCSVVRDGHFDLRGQEEAWGQWEELLRLDDLTPENGWLSATGELYLRASVQLQDRHEAKADDTEWTEGGWSDDSSDEQGPVEGGRDAVQMNARGRCSKAVLRSSDAPPPAGADERAQHFSTASC